MEVAIIWFLSMYGMGEYIKKVDNHNKALGAYIARVDEEMNRIDEQHVDLAVSYAAFRARQVVQQENLQERIQKLEGE
tara:strand:- start:79 stop:312 length:234 start_codon:yes stop_codon:yes gene_type:complete